jgi:hypothetical protein
VVASSEAFDLSTIKSKDTKGFERRKGEGKKWMGKGKMTKRVV